MKKNLFTVVLILSGFLLFFNDLEAQEFENGEIAVGIDDYGAINIYAPNFDNAQIDRSSILIGENEMNVFSYWDDAETVDTSRNVEDPQLSDYEIFVSFDNTYNNEPPDVFVGLNMYGWEMGGFAIAKFTIQNTGEAELNAVIGMENIPIVDGSYGLESVEWLPDDEVISIYRAPTSTFSGIKLLSNPITSLTNIEWYSGYDDLEADLWGWLTYGAIDDLFNAQGDGAVNFFSQDQVMLEIDGITEFWVAYAVGMDEAEMLANMDSAVEQYGNLTSVESDYSEKPVEFKLNQNYPNPFNPNTTISFNIPEREHVFIKVFNALGKEVATLVNNTLETGNHKVNFNPVNLPSGVYFYTITAGNFVDTKKMILLK